MQGRKRENRQPEQNFTTDIEIASGIWHDTFTVEQGLQLTVRTIRTSLVSKYAQTRSSPASAVVNPAPTADRGARDMSLQPNPHKTAGTAAAHELAATLERLGLDPPASEVVCVARLESRRLRIVVSITEIKEGEEKLHLTPLGRQILGIDQPTQSHQPPLREVERAILDAAPDKVPLTIKSLARASGYSYSSYTREAVAELLRRGLLMRTAGGVLRARPTTTATSTTPITPTDKVP